MLHNVTKTINEGDLAVAYLGPSNMKLFKVQRGQMYNNKYGAFSHDSMIGKPWGVRLDTPKRGYIHILQPTPELWTEVLPHRTQILYLADIAMVTAMLDVFPGSVVIESGTGSGSMSHSLARTIAPTGHLHTFEFHQERAEKAKAEFHEHGLSSIVTSYHRDVCKEGFQLVDVADAVFLDLPSPWDALDSSKAAMKRGQVTRLCSFSPCVEQVQKTCQKLQALGFFDLRVFETLQRNHDVKTMVEKPLPQRPSRDAPRQTKRKAEDDEDQGDQNGDAGDEASADNENENENEIENENEKENDENKSKNKNENGGAANRSEAPRQGETKVVVSRPMREVRGHTSYLLFASLFKE
ncbi:adenine-N(1)--methyltransferase catalytic subunit TRMT61A-like protein [Zopfochytrium polystomum]|nr:adenine-N(1)--methyltransferase catalytic subunit TRMT61A-like protein [Zopfochytrium polystomum]